MQFRKLLQGGMFTSTRGGRHTAGTGWCGVLLLLVLTCGLPAIARAAIIDQPMTGSAAPGWVFGGTPNAATLTGNGTIDPAGDGWLRLTDTQTNQAGYAFYDTPFSITQGVVIQFDYTTWGGNGADGYTVFLFDGAIGASNFQVGASGGSLGYAQKTVNPVSPGLSGGYLGIGIDEYGNFSNPTEGRVGGPGQRPNSLAVRGPDSTSYAYLGGTAANVGQLWFNQASRPLQSGSQYRKVLIHLIPQPAPDYLRVDVYVQFGYNQPLTQVLSNLMVGRPPPPTLKIGYAASTGGSTNYHEIRNLLIDPVSTSINLAMAKTASVASLQLGDPVTYTLTARNYGPTFVTASDVPIVDSVPPQITGVSWTCSGSGGATCGAASGSGNSLNTTATLPFNSAATYTITGTLTSPVAGSTLVNTASLTVPAPLVDYNPADNSASAAIDVSGDLSASTKTVVDVNGGDVQPGDVLRYTINLVNTGAGNATGVSVSDDIPADLNNFNVVSTPAGASDNSTFAGTGSNGNGLLNVSGITVPGGGSTTIVYEVTVNNGVADGTVITNSATVANPQGAGATPTAQVTVTNSFAPISGNKQLYLYDNSASPQYQLSRIKPSGLTGTVTLASGGGSQTWSLNPALASPVTTLGSNLTVNLWLANTSNRDRNRNLEARLACSSAPATYATTGNLTLRLPPAGNPGNFPLTLSGNLPLTCAAGDSWQLTVINPNNRNNRDFILYPMNGGSNSYVDLPSQNVINVDSIVVYDAAYPAGSAVPLATPGQTVQLRAVVSDPFGSFDISAVHLTLTDSTGSVRLNNVAMTQVADSGGATRTYEYAYSLPADAAAGNWAVRVTADEGTEGTVSDFGQVALPVAALQPLLTIIKSASNATAKPGDVITYTIQVQNTGSGAATSVVLDDHLSHFTAFGLNSYAGTPFQFADGSPSSGLALGTPVYSADGGTTYGSYIPASGGGGAPAGYDGTITNWKIPMSGTMAAGSSFTLHYQVKVK